jgi:hypothetical protein
MKIPRFSLRFAILVFTVIGVVLGLYGRHMVNLRKQMRLTEVARNECEKGGCVVGLHGNPSTFYLIGISAGPQLTEQAARAIGEAQLIKRVLVWEPVSGPVDAELSANFHRAEDYSPKTCIWERNGWEVPKQILDRRNGLGE